MKKLISAFFILLITIPLIAFQIIFDVPATPLLLIHSQSEWQEMDQCYVSEPELALDNNGVLHLLVWNIYKENRSEWQQELEALSESAQLVLLQEGSQTKSFIGWQSSNAWLGSHVKAFDAFGVSAGVINLSRTKAEKVCAFTKLEPWLRLPKSALYALFPLSNGQTLAVVNIHAVNFTFGVQEYSEQIKELKEAVSGHDGPLVVAGDFNSWSSNRMETLVEVMGQLGLYRATFKPDNRTKVITGYRLDHVFFRGMELITAKAPVTDASDHNPLQVSFRIQD